MTPAQCLHADCRRTPIGDGGLVRVTCLTCNLAWIDYAKKDKQCCN